MNREQTLETALQLVMHSRNKDYADPEENFQAIAELWTFWLKNRYNIDFVITPLDVAMMSAFIKISRMLENPYKEDNFVDIAGYAACAAEVAQIELDRINRQTEEINRSGMADPSILAGMQWPVVKVEKWQNED